ncbi:hypothetical protein AV530_006937 [Patagioenas fasciata monilis]|uniref:Uncharacterized protein n=1 Tax=Patagioenas fasciata monilis TaxID=372326 RepID=A0A1V4J8M9_PATFA|nr:hypothetical protein AV530_006937 [Patagioenas fasciata monilis]
MQFLALFIAILLYTMSRFCHSQAGALGTSPVPGRKERERQDGTSALRGCCQKPSSTEAAGTLRLEEAFGAARAIEESTPSWGCCGWPGSCWDVQQLCMWNEPRVNMKGTCIPTDLQATRKDRQQTE